MKVCGYNVLPIVTDQLNLYNVVRFGAERSGSVGQGGERRDRHRHGRELATVDRAFSECHFECFGWASHGLVRHGSALVGCCIARRGLVRQGLTTAD